MTRAVGLNLVCICAFPPPAALTPLPLPLPRQLDRCSRKLAQIHDAKTCARTGTGEHRLRVYFIGVLSEGAPRAGVTPNVYVPFPICISCSFDARVHARARPPLKEPAVMKGRLNLPHLCRGMSEGSQIAGRFL